jgi:hypothetical protein
MRLVILLALLIPSLVLAGGIPVGQKEAIPSASEEQQPLEPETISPPFFTRDMVAKDMSPEYLTLLNAPTPENAAKHVAAVVTRWFYAMAAAKLSELEKTKALNLAAKAYGVKFSGDKTSSDIMFSKKLSMTELMIGMANHYGSPVPQSFIDWYKSQPSEKRSELDAVATTIFSGK